MNPLYVHPWVCSWVFDNIMTCPFHTDFLLPIHFFQNPFVFRAETRFYNSYVSTILNSQCEGHNNLIPAYSRDNITVGYSICFSSDSERHANRTNRIPFFPPFIARIVLDHTNNRLMFFIPSVSTQLIALLVYTVSDSSQFTFIFPAKDYDWDSLPDDPMIAFQASGVSPKMTNVNGPLPTYEVPSNGITHLNETDLTPKDVAELMSSLSISKTNSNNTTNESATPFSNAIAAAIRRNNWSNTIFGMHSYQSLKNLTPSSHLLSHDQWLKFDREAANIMDKLTVYFGNRIDENPVKVGGYDYIKGKRRHHYVFERCEGRVSQAVGPKSAHIYYSAMLSLTPDRRLLQNVSFDQSPEDISNVENDQLDSKEETKAENIPKPRHVVLEERRKRNRLSAERSNAKKREKLRNMKIELESSRVRIMELKRRQMKELERNQQLRGMVNMTRKS